MALKHRLHPSLLLVLVPLAVTAFAVYVTGWRWPGLAAGMSGKTQYWFLRSTPVPALLLGPLAGLLTVWPLPLHRRRPIAIASLLGFVVVTSFYALREYGRLAPSVERGIIAWDKALSYLDLFAVAGSFLGFLIVAVSARISVVVADPVKRAKGGAFGDADWLSMRAAARLFPPDGEIVVGERYRVDRELVHKLSFDPNDRSTWGQGGRAPLLTYQQDFDSTHMLFFAGSGGFKNQAHNLLTGLLAHVMLSPEYAGRRTLRSLRQIVSEPEPSVLAMLRDVQENSQSDFIRETLGVFTNMTEQTFSGVYSTASKDTQWLSLASYAGLVCGNAFRSRDIVSGKKDVFLNVPAAILRSYPGIGRVIIGSLIKAMVQADGAFDRRTLFMLDEVDLLGYMRVLEEARDRGRKYGISLMLMYQSVGQLERHFGKDGATSWIDGCAFASYAAVKALDTARSVSAQCGEMTVEVKGRSRNVGWSSSTTRSRQSESVNFQRRPLIMPHEVTQSMRKDEQIVIVQGQSPIRCGRAIYFRRKDMNEAAKANRFVKTSL